MAGKLASCASSFACWPEACLSCALNDRGIDCAGGTCPYALRVLGEGDAVEVESTRHIHSHSVKRLHRADPGKPDRQSRVSARPLVKAKPEHRPQRRVKLRQPAARLPRIR